MSRMSQALWVVLDPPVPGTPGSSTFVRSFGRVASGGPINEQTRLYPLKSNSDAAPPPGASSFAALFFASLSFAADAPFAGRGPNTSLSYRRMFAAYEPSES